MSTMLGVPARIARFIVALVVPFVLLAGCSDKKVDIGEVGDLEQLSTVRVTVNPGVVKVANDEARTGVIIDGNERVHFAVIVGDAAPRRATIRSRMYRLVSGCAGAGFYTDRSRFGVAASTVERAVYEKLAPDAYCEG